LSHIRNSVEIESVLAALGAAGRRSGKKRRRRSSGEETVLIDLARNHRLIGVSVLLAAIAVVGGAQAQSAPSRIGNPVISKVPGAVQGQPAPAPVVSPIISKVPGGVGRVLGPIGQPSGLATPQDIAAPFLLNTVFIAPALANNPSAPSTTLVIVQNPSIVFQFPIVPDMDYWPAGYKSSPTFGVTAAVGTEACLTAQEATAWPGATEIQPTDTTGCPTEDDLVHTRILPRAWYQVASVNVDEYVVQNSEPVQVASPAPVQLQQIDTPMRFHLKGFIYQYGALHTGPNDYNAACKPPQCGNGNFEVRTNPFTVVVLPAFMFQLKVLPQTIVYLPPGNASFGSYTVTTTFTTTLTAGDTSQIDNSNSNDQWTEDVDQTDASVDISKILSLGFSSSDDTKWDTKTTVKAGQSQEHDLQSQTQVQIAATAKVIASTANVPGKSGTPANEPFRGDDVIVLVHPQFAVWDFYGKTTVQLIAASNSTTPDDIGERVSDLDACASGIAPFPNGIPFTAATGAQDVLTAADCRNLVILDPFYGKGQAANVSARGTLFAAQQAYGVAPSSPPGPGNGLGLDLKQISSLQTTVTNQSTQTYASTVEDIVATSQSAGLKIGASAPISGLTLGLSNTTTVKQGTNSDNSQTMTLTYKNSSATSFRQDIAIEGSINDNQNRGYPPQVAVYLDNIFGGMMPVDPDAPPVPCKPQPICTVAAPVGSQPVEAQ
jgi:hypothetical protein